MADWRPDLSPLILARHGESEYSARGLCNGDITIPVGLTGEGREEAHRLGTALESEPLDLCVTSEFERARETADLALSGRDVPRLVFPDLNDPRVGPFEGATVAAFREWAVTASSSDSPGHGGESRLAIVERYARAFRALVARPESSILAVCHSLPVAYALAARQGRAPAAREPIVPTATPYPFLPEELAAAAAVLEQWVAHPSW